MSLIIHGPKIYADSGIIADGVLLIEEGRIHACRGDRSIAEADVTFPSTYSLIPGRIDLHVHGIAGVDVMDATPAALTTMSRMLAQEGTTSFLATTMSMPVEAISAAIENVRRFMENKHHTGARILGLHLEGPFIAPDKMGAHQGEYLLPPDVELMRKWQTLAAGAIKLVTLAPELTGADSLIACLMALGIVPSIGHSNASHSVALEAIHQGCRHITHLFNAMSGLHHRSPGVALAALESHALAEIIADGEHVSWEILKFVMRVKGPHELCVVTDSMRAKCMPDGKYLLGQQDVFVKQGAARLADGTLAGSVLTMEKAVQNLLTQGICDLPQSIHLCSINPAKQLGIFDKTGSIAPGKWADVVVLDEKQHVVMTVCQGEIIWVSQLVAQNKLKCVQTPSSLRD
jgi:N-acetylglucosamine-6-phosphate deacetylase